MGFQLHHGLLILQMFLVSVAIFFLVLNINAYTKWKEGKSGRKVCWNVGRVMNGWL